MIQILILVIAMAVAGFAGYRHGHSTGVDEQKVSDQAEFDKINKKLSDLEKKKADLIKEGNDPA